MIIWKPLPKHPAEHSLSHHRGLPPNPWPVRRLERSASKYVLLSVIQEEKVLLLSTERTPSPPGSGTLIYQPIGGWRGLDVKRLVTVQVNGKMVIKFTS